MRARDRRVVQAVEGVLAPAEHERRAALKGHGAADIGAIGNDQLQTHRSTSWGGRRGSLRRTDKRALRKELTSALIHSRSIRPGVNLGSDGQAQWFECWHFCSLHNSQDPSCVQLVLGLHFLTENSEIGNGD